MSKNKVYEVFDIVNDTCVPYDQFRNQNYVIIIHLKSFGFFKLLIKSLIMNPVIHTHHVKSLVLLNLFLAKGKRKYRYHTIHAPYENYGRCYKYIVEKLNKNNVIFNSEFTKASFLKKNYSYIESKVVHNGVNMDKLKKYRFDNRLPIGLGEKTILLCGRDVKVKNLKYTLDALMKMNKLLQKKIKVFIVSHLEENKDHRFFDEFLGSYEVKSYCQQTELWWLASKVNLIISMSRYEGYGNFQVECSMLNNNLLLSNIPTHKHFFSSRVFVTLDNLGQYCSILVGALEGSIQLNTKLLNSAIHDRNYCMKLYEGILNCPS